VKMRRVACDWKTGWLAWPTLVVVLGAGCSSALDNRQRSAPDAGAAQAQKPGAGEPAYPTPDLAAKHEAAKAAPESFEPVMAYAEAVADFCLASLVDDSCAPDCPKGQVKYKPMSDLAPKNWVLAQDGLATLKPLKDGQGLPPAQFEKFIAVKGRLLGLAGHAAQEKTLIEGYAVAHPDAISVVKRRLEMLREAGNVEESEAQCARSRVSMKKAAKPARTELLTTCVALHPDNKDGETYLPDYAKYLPAPSRAEQRLYRRHLVSRCIENVGSKETRCAEACDCKGKAADKRQRAECKKKCRGCRVETAQQIRACKKTGFPAPARAPRQKGAPVEPPPAVDPASTPKQAVL
jgi:hypothetical protein